MKFRPCIDIHNGKVKQIVGGSLLDKGDYAQDNFVSEKDGDFYAKLYKDAGLEVCQQIREFSSVPIIMLTAKGEDMDKILGLEYGADDYITKPFNILEVKARIKAIMRRTQKEKKQEERSNTLEAGDMRLDCEGRRIFIAGKEINLTAKEFDVLELLVKNPNKVYSRENLLNLVW